MRKIAIALSKGGVGKSTTAVTLAYGLSMLDKRVLLIDTDSQNQCAEMLGTNPQLGLSDLFLDGSKNAGDVVTECRENLWLVSAGNTLAEAQRGIAQKQFRSEETLTKALAPFDGAFDICVIDTAPAWGVLNINTLFYADEVISPVSLEVLSLGGLARFVRNVEAIKEYREDLEIKWILPTFHDKRVRRSQEVLNQVIDYFLDKVCEPIRYSVKLSECPGYGQTIFEYAPRDRTARDYGAFITRVLEDG